MTGLGAAADPPAVAYMYAPGRGGEHAVAPSRRLLRHAAGRRLRRLQAADRARARRRPAACSPTAGAHFRRQFYDIAKGGNAPIASGGAAAHRGALCHRGRDPRPGRRRAPRRHGRREQSRSSTSWRRWLKQQLARVSKGSDDRQGDPLRPEPLGRASAASSTTAASRSTPTPSSAHAADCTEQEKCTLRRQRRGRATTGPAIASLIETCKLNAVNPHAWLDRHADEARQPLACLSHRRADALGLRKSCPDRRQRVSGATLTERSPHAPRSWSRSRRASANES